MVQKVLRLYESGSSFQVFSHSILSWFSTLLPSPSYSLGVLASVSPQDWPTFASSKLPHKQNSVVVKFYVKTRMLPVPYISGSNMTKCITHHKQNSKVMEDTRVYRSCAHESMNLNLCSLFIRCPTPRSQSANLKSRPCGGNTVRSHVPLPLSFFFFVYRYFNIHDELKDEKRKSPTSESKYLKPESKKSKTATPYKERKLWGCPICNIMAPVLGSLDYLV